MSGSVFCFGELLLRMSPSLGQEWIRANSMPVFIGGAELNVATALAGWKIPVKYCTALPDHYLSQEIMQDAQQKNIDTSAIHLSGERIGVYYLPQGADLKNAGVIYDRAYSSFASLKPGMIDWDKVLDDCSWFHFTAISPALNENVVAVCKEGLEVATKKGLTISVDLNFRAKLWKYGKLPVEVMPSLAEYCHLIMGNIWAAHNLLGMPLDKEVETRDNKASYLDHAHATSTAIFERFPNCKYVANTFRFDAGKGIHYYASLNTKEDQFVSPEFNTQSVVDKIGSGDCFMGGLIYGMHREQDAQSVISYAAAAAFGKLQEKSDATRQTVSDVQKVLNTAIEAAI
ncbi:MAG: sugar kinase [Pedobacter sp.]|nr:MAG: sugar kinase [Pedobacter sp.]